MISGVCGVKVGSLHGVMGVLSIGGPASSPIQREYDSHFLKCDIDMHFSLVILFSERKIITIISRLRRHLIPINNAKKIKNLHSFALFPVPMPSKFFEVNARLISPSALTLGTDYVTQTSPPHTLCLPHPYRSHCIGMSEHSCNYNTRVV